MARQNRKKGSGTLLKVGKYFHLQYMINGVTKRTSLKCTTEREARKKADELLPILQAKTKEQIATHVAEARKLANKNKVKIELAWELFLKNNSRPDSSEGTLGNYKRMWNRFKDWLQSNYASVTSLSDINENHALEYSEDLWAEGISANTYNYHIQAIKLILKTLSRQAGMIVNPFDILSRKAENRQSRKELSEKEVLSIIDSFDAQDFHLLNKEEMKVLFHLGIWTGLRLVDCVSLKWENIDFQRNIITCEPQKTARKTHKIVSIPIHPSLRNALEDALGWQENEYVLPKIYERYHRNPDGIKKDAIKVFEKNGFDTTQAIKGVQRKRKANIYGFHSFRHSFVSFCAKAGVPLPVVQSIVGHGNPAITRHYIHIGEESVKQAINALPKGQEENVKTESEKIEEVVNFLKAKKKLSESDKKILEILD